MDIIQIDNTIIHEDKICSITFVPPEKTSNNKAKIFISYSRGGSTDGWADNSESYEDESAEKLWNYFCSKINVSL